jgi:hypothetical protein
MQHIHDDAQPAPFNTTAEVAAEHTERLRQYAADAPPSEWEDEWVDLGGEG